MTLIASLSQIPTDVAEQARALVVQLLQEQNPDLDVRRGVFYDLVIQLSTMLVAMNQTNIDRVIRSSSVLELSKDPTLADDDTVDRLASNAGQTRSAGSPASGLVAIVLGKQVAITVSAGSVFSGPLGTTFTADDTYNVRLTSEEVISDTDRLLVASGSSTYTFTINVTATEIGPDGILVRGTGLTPPIVDSSVKSAYAASDFTGGLSADTNEDMLAKLGSGLLGRGLASPTTADDYVRSLELDSFDDGLAVSMVGMGNQEMLRYYGMLPVAYGGRTDLFVRPCQNVVRTVYAKTATFINTLDTGGKWRFTFDRDEQPGFYQVSRALLISDLSNTQATGLTILTVTRSLDTSAVLDVSAPDARDYDHGSFSRYQTMVVDFYDPAAPDGLTPGTSTVDYGVETVGLPDIDTIQDAVNSQPVRFAPSDCLVRAAVPCFCSVVLTVRVATGATEPDTDDIKDAVSAAVGSTGFPGKLSTATIAAAAQEVVGSSGTVTATFLQGRLLRPDGTPLNISGSTSLEPVEDFAHQVTARTVAFFMAPEDITVTLL